MCTSSSLPLFLSYCLTDQRFKSSNPLALQREEHDKDGSTTRTSTNQFASVNKKTLLCYTLLFPRGFNSTTQS